MPGLSPVAAPVAHAVRACRWRHASSRVVPSNPMQADDLAAYLDRVGVARPTAPDRAALTALQWAHVRAIPFENLDLVVTPADARPIAIDLPSIVSKLVRGGRGGYCFEHNTLFAAVLSELGYGVTALAARVRWLATAAMPRTHMLLAVDVPGDARYLVDVGFGGTNPTAPIALTAGSVHSLHHDRYRLRAEDGGLVLELELTGGVGTWSDLYWFTLEPHHPVDFEVANHYTSTHPQSRFLAGPICALTTERGRLTVRGGEIQRRTRDGVEREPLIDGERLLEVLATEFGLVFRSGTRFRGGPP